MPHTERKPRRVESTHVTQSSQRPRSAARTHKRRSRPGGTGTQGIASRLFFPDKGKKTGVNRGKMSQQKRNGKREPRANRPSRTASLGREARAKRRNRIPAPRRTAPRAQTPVPGLYPAGTYAAPADILLPYKAEQRPAAPARKNAGNASRAPSCAARRSARSAGRTSPPPICPPPCSQYRR